MKYNNLLRFLLKWSGNNVSVYYLTDTEGYNRAMVNTAFGESYKSELKLAHKEYLEYLEEKE